MNHEKDTEVLNDVMMKVRRMVKDHAFVVSETASLIESCEVLLLIRGLPEHVQLTASQPCILGRADPASSDQQVDLTPHGANIRGVSRRHACLKLIKDRIYLEDLDSTNGTHLAGQRLEPNQPIELRKGQEFHLGQLGIQLLVM